MDKLTKEDQEFISGERNPNMDCHWHQDDYMSATRNKIAVGVCMLMLLISYTILVGWRYRKTDKHAVVEKLYDIVNDFVLSHLFFYIAAILVHTIVPKEFPVILLYFYMISMVFEAAGSMSNKAKLMKYTWGIQTLLLVILYITIMSDNWCRFFLYRGHA